MKEGMLWYVNDQDKELKATIETAVNFFRTKYGQTPLACYVHPDALPAEFESNDLIKVMANEMVIRNHLWLELPTD